MYFSKMGPIASRLVIPGKAYASIVCQLLGELLPDIYLKWSPVYDSEDVPIFDASQLKDCLRIIRGALDVAAPLRRPRVVELGTREQDEHLTNLLERHLRLAADYDFVSIDPFDPAKWFRRDPRPVTKQPRADRVQVEILAKSFWLLDWSDRGGSPDLARWIVMYQREVEEFGED